MCRDFFCDWFKAFVIIAVRSLACCVLGCLLAAGWLAGVLSFLSSSFPSFIRSVQGNHTVDDMHPALPIIRNIP